MKYIAGFIIGALTYTLGLNYYAMKHDDVMRELSIDMAKDSYYIGCRRAGGDTMMCHSEAEDYIKPMIEGK